MVITTDQRKTYPDLEGLLLDIGVQLTAPSKVVVDSLEKFKKLFNMMRPSLARSLATKAQAILNSAPPMVTMHEFDQNNLILILK